MTSVLPDVPTTLEAGYPNSDYNFWIGVFAPAKTPRAIVERLNAEVSKALATPAIVEKLEKIGVQPVAMTSNSSMSLCGKSSKPTQSLPRQQELPGTNRANSTVCAVRAVSMRALRQ